jgi:aryl-alcohol dehydrogenase-like predicted oxidoreductase
MKGSRPAELVAGSSYGIIDMPARETALSIVRRAADAGIEKFETTRHGDCESRIGEALEGRKTVRTITALNGLDDLPLHAIASVVRGKVDESIERSLTALRREKLDCVLLPRAKHRTAWHGALWERLIELLEDGVVLSLGVAVQSPAEALAALSCADVQHIQLPFNILDWRWRSAGVVERLSDRSSVTVHARNTFLDGLLTANSTAAWPRLPGLAAHGIMDWLEETARFYERDSVADLCLAFVRGQHWIDGVVLEMETEERLDTNLRLSVCPPLGADACGDIEATRPRVALALLDPAQWPRK